MKAKKELASALPATCSKRELMIDGNDLYLRRTIDNLSTLSWLLERIRSSLSEAVGVSPFQYKVLQTIGRLPMDTGWSIGALARHFRVTDAYVSTEVSGLIKLSLLKGTVNPADRRSKLVALTDQALEALTAVAEQQQRANDLTYSQFDRKSLTEFGSIVEKMVDHADAASALLAEHRKEQRRRNFRVLSGKTAVKTRPRAATSGKKRATT